MEGLSLTTSQSVIPKTRLQYRQLWIQVENRQRVGIGSYNLLSGLFLKESKKRNNSKFNRHLVGGSQNSSLIVHETIRK